MRNLFICRRTFIATLGIICLTGIGLYSGHEVHMSIAAVCAALAGANAWEGRADEKAKSGSAYGPGQ